MHNVNYFNVILVGDKNYEVVQTPHKNKIFRKKSALTNLKNIEKVLTQNLVLKGENSTSSHENKLSALRMISQYITDNYSAKVSKLNWLSRKLFSKEKQVQALNKKIRETINHLATPSLFDKVPAEITTLIGNFLDENSLKKLAQASKFLNDQVGYNFICEAKRYGFEGDDVEGAKKFLKAFEKQLNFALKETFMTDLSSRSQRKKWDKIRAKPIEEKVAIFKNLSTEQVIDSLIVSYDRQRENLAIFDKFFKTLTFPPIVHLEESRRLSLNIILSWSIESSLSKFSKFLLNNGADANYTNINGDRLFAEVIKKGDVELVKDFMEHGATLDALQNENFSPLSLACGIDAPLLTPSTSEAMVRLLLDNGANPNQLVGGVSLLIRLCCGENNFNPTILQALLEQGINLDVTDANGMHAIHYLCLKGNLELLKIFVDNLLNRNPAFDINLRNRDGYTPLFYACGAHAEYDVINTCLVEFLLKKGANPNIKIGEDCLIDFVAPIANKSHDFNALQLLLKNTHVENVKSSLKYLWHNLASNQDVLVNPELLQLLLENGADPNQVIRGDKTPLHFAAQIGNEKAVELLLKYGAKVNAGERGKTPLLFALGFGESDYYKPSVKVAELLLNAGAIWSSYNLNSYDYYAVIYSSEEMIDFLLKQKKISPSWLEQKGLKYLTQEDFVESEYNLEKYFKRFIFLLDKGADPNCYDLIGLLPIHHLANQGKFLFLKMLLQYGLSPTPLTQNGASLKMLIRNKIANFRDPAKKLEVEKLLQPVLGDLKDDPYSNGAAQPPVSSNGFMYSRFY